MVHKNKEKAMKIDMLYNSHQNTIDGELLRLADKVCAASIALTSTHTPQMLHGIKELFRPVASYYSNAIDSEGTHPSLMDSYEKEGFSKNSKNERLQRHSLKYMNLQKKTEEYFDRCNAARIPKNIIVKIHDSLFGSSEDESVDENIFNFKCPKNTTKAEKMIHALQQHYFIVEIYGRKSNNYRLVSRLVLDGLLSTLEGYGLWSIQRGLHEHSTQYEEYLNMNDESQEIAGSYLGNLSAENSNSYIKFMLEVALEQVEYSKEHLNIKKIYTNIQNYVILSRQKFFDFEPLSEGSEYLFKELLLLGEISRGDVELVINKKTRTATYLNKKLINMDLITSDTPKGPIRLKFNMHLASYLFPGLIK